MYWVSPMRGRTYVAVVDLPASEWRSFAVPSPEVRQSVLNGTFRVCTSGAAAAPDTAVAAAAEAAKRTPSRTKGSVGTAIYGCNEPVVRILLAYWFTPFARLLLAVCLSARLATRSPTAIAPRITLSG
jgi:hypothetical protein